MLQFLPARRNVRVQQALAPCTNYCSLNVTWAVNRLNSFHETIHLGKCTWSVFGFQHGWHGIGICNCKSASDYRPLHWVPVAATETLYCKVLSQDVGWACQWSVIATIPALSHLQVNLTGAAILLFCSGYLNKKKLVHVGVFQVHVNRGPGSISGQRVVADAHSPSMVQGCQNRRPVFAGESINYSEAATMPCLAGARLSCDAKFRTMACSVRFDSPAVQIRPHRCPGYERSCMLLIHGFALYVL